MKLTHCARGGEPFPNTVEAVDTWAVTTTDGVPTGIVCPGCQTPEEHAEAEVRAALDRPATQVQVSSEALDSIRIEAMVADAQSDHARAAGLRRALEILGQPLTPEETP